MEVTQQSTDPVPTNASNETVDISQMDVSHQTDVELGSDRSASPKRQRKVLDDGDDEDDELFDSSTHQYLIYFGATNDVPKLVVSLFVICVQLVLYCVILMDAAKGIAGDDFTIPVKVRFGRSCEKSQNLVCPPELPNLGYTTLAGCILAFFLMHDIIAGIRILVSVPGCWGKLGGFIVLTESFMAATAGTLFALSANEGYDAIANCIGVLFIHDVDEKAFEAFKAIKFDKIKKNLCSKLSAPHSVVFIAMFAVMVFSISMAGIVREVQLKHITEIYGASYTEKYFGDNGMYTYIWEEEADYDPSSFWDQDAGDSDGNDDYGSNGGSDSDTDTDSNGGDSDSNRDTDSSTSTFSNGGDSDTDSGTDSTTDSDTTTSTGW